jgi:hypothetical protein
VFRHHANDQARTTAISDEIEHAFSQGRKVLVLTERTDHFDAISTAWMEGFHRRSCCTAGCHERSAPR